MCIDSYMGSPYKHVWLPVGGKLFLDLIREAEELKGLKQAHEIWEYIGKNDKSDLVSQCGFYDTASREAFYNYF